jgi:hypothetical protein
VLPREWVVVSQCAQSCRLSWEEGDTQSPGADAIRVMAWAQLFGASHQGVTEWRLLTRVMREIEEAARVMPGLYLRKLVLHVYRQNRCAEAQEVDASFLAEEFVTFTFNDGPEERVKVSALLPHDDASSWPPEPHPHELAVGPRIAWMPFLPKPSVTRASTCMPRASSSRAPSSTPAQTAGSARRTRSRRCRTCARASQRLKSAMSNFSISLSMGAASMASCSTPTMPPLQAQRRTFTPSLMSSASQQGRTGPSSALC